MESPTPPNKPSTGLRVTGSILLLLTIIMSLVALRNIFMAIASSGSFSRIAGIVIGSLIFPILFGYLTYYCFKKAGQR